MIIMREDLMCKLVNYKKKRANCVLPVLLTVLQKFYTASNTANQEYLNVGELSNCYWCLCLSTWRTSQTSILFLVTAWKTLSNMYCKQVVLIQDSLIDEPILVLIYFFLTGNMYQVLERVVRAKLDQFWTLLVFFLPSLQFFWFS